MTDPLDPTGLEQRRARVRPLDHDQRGHGAATDPADVQAFQRACERRRAESATTAVRVGRQPRGYTTAQHERAEALRGEAASLRRMAQDKRDPVDRRLLEREAGNLEADAEAIVPRRHARAGWR
jgi:hypothetical protein